MVSLRGRLSRLPPLPIRARLTIAFAAVIALVLAVAGAFLYSQLENDLDAEINASLRQEATSLATLVEQGRGDTIAGSEFGIAQIYGADARVFASTLRARGGRLLTHSEVAGAAHAPLRFDGEIPRSGAAPRERCEPRVANPADHPAGRGRPCAERRAQPGGATRRAQVRRR